MELGEAEIKKGNGLDSFNLPLHWHDHFNNTVWRSVKDSKDPHWPLPERPSFHNRDHIKAVESAIESYFANSSEENDPLNLRNDLKRWNEDNPSQQITFEELKKIMSLVAKCHDLGNIMEGVKVQDRKLMPIFLDRYTAKDAEERSKQIIEVIIRNLEGMDDFQKAKYIELAKHLIDQTTYEPKTSVEQTEPEPFSIAMRFFDQIGNGLFSKVAKDEMILGLLAEMIGENPEVEINPYLFWNFVIKRPDELGIDKETFKRILDVLGKKLPKEDTRFPNQLMKATEFLKTYSKRFHIIFFAS